MSWESNVSAGFVYRILNMSCGYLLVMYICGVCSSMYICCMHLGMVFDKGALNHLR